MRSKRDCMNAWGDYPNVQITHTDAALWPWVDTLGVLLVRDTRKLALSLLPVSYAESTYCLAIALEELCLRLFFKSRYLPRHSKS